MEALSNNESGQDNIPHDVGIVSHSIDLDQQIKTKKIRHSQNKNRDRAWKKQGKHIKRKPNVKPTSDFQRSHESLMKLKKAKERVARKNICLSTKSVNGLTNNSTQQKNMEKTYAYDIYNANTVQRTHVICTNREILIIHFNRLQL